jgi:subtilisin family serine protease
VMPSATADELAAAIIGTIQAGARVLNLSLALVQPASRGERALQEALDYAGDRGVITVVATGNQGAVGSSVVTRHPWVIPVAGCDLQGKPMNRSNLGRSIGQRGLSAPGEGITSLGSSGRPVMSGGTSVATPFVTGAVALLWSEFPDATAAEVRFALTQAAAPGRRTIVPPILDAWAAYRYLAAVQRRRRAI